MGKEGSRETSQKATAVTQARDDGAQMKVVTMEVVH